MHQAAPRAIIQRYSCSNVGPNYEPFLDVPGTERCRARAACTCVHAQRARAYAHAAGGALSWTTLLNAKKLRRSHYVASHKVEAVSFDSMSSSVSSNTSVEWSSSTPILSREATERGSGQRGRSHKCQPTSLARHSAAATPPHHTHTNAPVRARPFNFQHTHLASSALLGMKLSLSSSACCSLGVRCGMVLTTEMSRSRPSLSRTTLLLRRACRGWGYVARQQDIPFPRRTNRHTCPHQLSRHGPQPRHPQSPQSPPQFPPNLPLNPPPISPSIPPQSPPQTHTQTRT